MSKFFNGLLLSYSVMVTIGAVSFCNENKVLKTKLEELSKSKETNNIVEVKTDET